MIVNILAKRYAKALLEPLTEEDAGSVRKYLDNFQNLLQVSPEMRKLFLSPVFGLEEKRGVLKVLSERLGFSGETRRFLGLLLEKDRLRYFREIRTFYETLLYERKNRVKAHVTSYNSLSQDHEELLKESLRHLTKKDVELDIRVDPSLIGGLVVRIGDVIYDGSIKGQLINIKEGLLGK
ncbi:MAG: ATP synthase F1 subunit delta [Nitrospirota bacterium]|mgnify:CR=1 FL=1